MCRRDRADAFGAWDIIEENVAAAVHLQVDKPGREPAPCWKSQNRCRRGKLSARYQGNDPLLFDNNCCVVMDGRAVEHNVGCDCVPSPAHLVRVTFCKWR